MQGPKRSHRANTGLAKFEFHLSYSGYSWVNWCKLHYLGNYTSRQTISKTHLHSDSALSKVPPVPLRGVTVVVGRLGLKVISDSSSSHQKPTPLDAPFSWVEKPWGLSDSTSLGTSLFQHIQNKKHTRSDN